MVFDNAGDILESKRGAAVDAVDADFGEVARRHNGKHVTYAQALVWSVDKAARTDKRIARELEDAGIYGVCRREHDLIERDAARFQALRINLNDHHLELFAPNSDVSDAGHGKQSGPDL